MWYLEKDATAVMSGHRQPGADSLAFSPDGKTCYAGGSDGTIKIWDVPNK
jgi:WD40 repeat protein